MFNSSNDKTTLMKIAVSATFIAALTFSPLAVAQEHEHGSDTAASKEVTGEVVDMMCYVDHNAVGEKHGQSWRAKVRQEWRSGRDRQRRQSVSRRRRTQAYERSIG